MKYLFLLFLLTFNAFAMNPDQIIGVWWSPEQKTKVEIYQQGDKYFGKIIALRPESKEKLDLNNKDKSKRSEKLLGLEILKNFEFKEDRWINGTIYDPENGKTYKSLMWFAGEEIDKLNIRGYVGFALIGRTAEFRKVQGENPKQQQDGEPARYYGE